MIIISILTFCYASGQEVSSNFFLLDSIKRSNLKNSSKGKTDFEEDGNYTNYKRWYHLWRYRHDENGDMSTGSKILKQWRTRSSEESKSLTCNPPEDDGINWVNLGPFNSEGTRNHSTDCSGRIQDVQNQGRIEAISVHPTNDQDILVAGQSSGIWRSIDGGQNWYITTDDEGLSLYGYTEILRHPADPNIVYVEQRNTCL